MMTYQRERAWGWAACCVWLALATFGCSAEVSNEGSDDSHLGETSQALEQFSDRPAAAAIGVGVGVNGVDTGTRQMWLFACGNDNLLYRRVKPSRSLDWKPEWTLVAFSPCAGVPTVGAWNALPQDEVELFFRSTVSGALIEVYWGTDGTRQEVNLSGTTGLGSIKGNPVIVDVGTNHRLALAVRDSSNRLKTLTYSPGVGWVIQSVTNAAGQQVHADGLLTSFYNDFVSYFSSSLSGTYRVFTRSTWTDPYVAVSDTIPNARGVLTFADPEDTAPVVIGRDGFDRVTKSFIRPGQPWSFSIANRMDVQSTPYMGASWSYEAARNFSQDRGVACDVWGSSCNITTLWGLSNSQTVSYFYPGQYLNSAGTKAVNAGQFMSYYVFYAAYNNRLNWVDMANYGQLGSWTDMGIDVLPP